MKEFCVNWFEVKRALPNTRSRSKKVVIETGNLIPLVEMDVQPFIDSWIECNNYFSKNKIVFFEGDEEFVLSVDVSDVIEMFLVFDMDFEIRMKERIKNKKHPFSCDITLDVKSRKAFEKTQAGYKTIFRFFQQLFVAMHISAPGCISFVEGKSTLGLEEKHGIDAFRLEGMYGHQFQLAYADAVKNKWPVLERLPFAVAWEWLHKREFYKLEVAHYPWEKACFTLLSLGNDTEMEEDFIFKIVRVLESIFVDGRENLKGLFKERIYLVLGEQIHNKKMLGSLYDLRSSIAHGSSWMVRPGVLQNNDDLENPYLWSLSSNLGYACSILIAVMQDMVKNDCTSYQFSQTIKKV